MQSTKKSILNKLRDALGKQCEQQLEGLPFAKRDRETYIDGFKSGLAVGIYHVTQMLEIEVIDDEETEK